MQCSTLGPGPQVFVARFFFFFFNIGIRSRNPIFSNDNMNFMLTLISIRKVMSILESFQDGWMDGFDRTYLSRWLWEVFKLRNCELNQCDYWSLKLGTGNLPDVY